MCILLGKLKGSSRTLQQNNIKMDLHGSEKVEWIHLAQDRVQWQVRKQNTETEFPAPQKAEDILASAETNSF